VIYIDTSVVLAQLLTEDKHPPSDFWAEHLVSSRLVEYEVWTRVNKVSARSDLLDATRGVLSRIALIELIPEVVARAKESFPVDVRTLDALHLSSAAFLMEQGVSLRLATYDTRMREAAKRVRLPLHAL